MANINNHIDVQVSAGSPSLARAGFGTLLFLSTSLGVGFTERVRYYTSAADAAADADLGAAAIAAVAAVFSQNPSINIVGIGRVAADVAMVETFEFAGTIEVGDVISITVNGIAVPYVATGAVLATEVAALKAAMITALAAEDVTVSGVAPDITITADIDGTPFTFDSAVTHVGTTTVAITETPTTPNTSVGTELSDIQAESDAWYAFAIESRAEIQILRAAAWAEASKAKLFVAQTEDSAVITAVTTDIMSQLKALNYSRTAIHYHNPTAEDYADCGTPGMKLQANPDQKSAGWKFSQIVGVTIDSISSTELGYIVGKNGNTFVDFHGFTVYANGIRSNGSPIEQLIAMDWCKARMTERLAQMLLNAAADNSKIDLGDAGLAAAKERALSVLLDGENASPPHFTPGSSSVTVPLASALSVADKAEGNLPMTFATEFAGTLTRIAVTGSVSVEL